MKPPTFRDRLEYLGVVLFVRAVRRVSLRTSLIAAAMLGRLAFDLFGFRRQVTLLNLKAHLTDDRLGRYRIRIARASYVNFGMGIAEFARLPLVDRAYVERNISLAGTYHLDEAVKRGRGAILVTGHFGSWELMGCVLAQLGYPVKFVVGIQRNPLVQMLMNDLRQRAGIEIVELTSTIEIVRSLRAGRFLAMLSDQDAGRKGVFVEFLGAQASTARGAARLAIATGAPIIPGFIVRSAAERHRITIEKPIWPGGAADKESEVLALTQAYTDVIASYVREYPDHYLWAHRRWKTKPL